MTLEILTTKQFNGQLNKLANLQKTSDSIIHSLACNAIYHSIKDGQVTPANQLIAKLGKSSRKNDLISWLVSYGNFKYDATKKTLEHRLAHKHDETAALLQATAAFDSPFYDEVKERKVLQSIDVLALLKSSVNRVKKEMKEAAENGRSLEIKHQELMTDMENLLNRFGVTA